MAQKRPFTLRLADAEHEALEALSRERGRTKTKIAADFIVAGLAGDSPSPSPAGEHPLLAEVAAMFADLEGVDVGTQRETCLALARIAVEGGSAGVAALRELRAAAAEVDRLAGRSVPPQRERWPA